MLNLQDRARLVLAHASLKNYGMALEMWALDHERYPDSLAELVPDYLRALPPGPTPWRYEPTSDRKAYALSLEGEAFAGWRAPACYSARGLEPAVPLREPLHYRVPVPEGWLGKPSGFRREGHQMLFTLGGPTRANETGPEWVEAEARRWATLPGQTISSSVAWRDRELEGLELRGISGEHRCHLFLVSDGELAWRFEYHGKPDLVYDELFVASIAARETR